LLAEFRELDSYLTDSDGEGGTSSGGACPLLAQTEFDNSLLRAGRALLTTAKDNPVLGTNSPPEVVFRLTRIDPDATDESGNDPRIAHTIESLRNMGLSIKLGERAAIRQLVDPAPVLLSPPAFIPTLQINLDLSILIALVSDLTHAPLPESVDAAHERFIPSAAYVKWKRSRLRAKSGSRSDSPNTAREDTDDPLASTQHSRALAAQQQQEMHKSIFQEIHERLAPLVTCHRQASPDGPTHDPTLPPHDAPSLIEFWTTSEARDRCLRIVAKIGGPAEMRRVYALFPTSSVDGDAPPSLSELETQFWADSRHRRGLLPLLPIRIFPTCNPPPPPSSPPAGFFSALEATCRALLEAGGVPPRRATESEVAGADEDEGEGEGGEIQRVSVVRTNARLTTHTVQSMLYGAAHGWTTLTANRASVKAMLREVKMRGYDVDVPGGGDGAVKYAALWVIDPRSLAEGMRSGSDLAPV
jgi:hypothetical protein